MTVVVNRIESVSVMVVLAVNGHGMRRPLSPCDCAP